MLIMIENFINSITRVKAAPCRKLPRHGTGTLHDEQQYCYEMGYREGVAALRKAQREYIEIYNSELKKKLESLKR
jgi:hypothetical protein